MNDKVIANVMKKLDKPIQPTTYDVSTFDKKIVQKEGIKFESNVILEQVNEGTDSKYMKKASLSLNLPGWSPWEVFIDEGVTGGGTDEAPSPLGYLSIGVAACLMTHLKETTVKHKLDIKSIRIEQRIKFHSTYNFGDIKPEDIYGHTKGLETNVVIESDEPQERLQQLVDLSEQACFALNAFINRIPASTNVFVNGRRVD